MQGKNEKCEILAQIQIHIHKEWRGFGRKKEEKRVVDH